jgi:hypothetical protein
MQSPLKPQIETPKVAESAFAHLVEVMDGLEAIVVEETALVRAGKLRGARALGPKKAELSSVYIKTLEQLKAQRLVARAVPQDVSALKRRHEKLHASLKVNLVVLATAHAVSEGIMRRLSGDLARKACPPVYGASGKTTAPDPRRAQPLALSRTL